MCVCVCVCVCVQDTMTYFSVDQSAQYSISFSIYIY